MTFPVKTNQPKMTLEGRGGVTPTPHTLLPPVELFPKSPLAEPNPEPEGMGASGRSPCKPVSYRHRAEQRTKKIENASGRLKGRYSA